MAQISKKKFSRVHIEISSICNLQCTFCPEVVREKKKMAVDQFATIIPQVAPLTEQVCLHLMGEPLVHPDLVKLLDLCAEHGARINLVTNGTLLNRHLSTLVHPALRQVNFSLHSFFDNWPDRDPEPYWSTISEYLQRVQVERPDLYINLRLWNLGSERGASEKNLFFLKKIQALNPDADLELGEIRRAKSRRVQGRIYLSWDTEFVWPDLDLPLLGEQGNCYGLRNHFGILVDGTVVPCCLDKEGVIRLGNVFDTPLNQILDSEKAKRMVLGFEKGQLLEPLCQRCQFIQRFKDKGPARPTAEKKN